MPTNAKKPPAKKDKSLQEAADETLRKLQGKKPGKKKTRQEILDEQIAAAGG